MENLLRWFGEHVYLMAVYTTGLFLVGIIILALAPTWFDTAPGRWTNAIMATSFVTGSWGLILAATIIPIFRTGTNYHTLFGIGFGMGWALSITMFLVLISEGRWVGAGISGICILMFSLGIAKVVRDTWRWERQ